MTATPEDECPGEFDGKYTVVSVTSYDGPFQKQSDGFTVIKGGKTLRIDGAGCQWHSTFERAGEDKVRMVSVIDPRYASDDFKLIGPDGTPTREPQTYEVELNAHTDGESLVLSGMIERGGEKTRLTMRRVKD